jgi:hypothetical protein
MNMLKIAAAAAFALAATTPAIGQAPSSPGRSEHQVLSWIDAGSGVAYVQDASGQWYRVVVTPPCADLRLAYGVALEASPRGTFGDATILVVGDQRCAIRSISRVDVPAIPPDEPPGGSGGA